MDFVTLQSFAVVAEEGTVSGAAARLHMSQPPLSVRLQRLENELGVQLLVRHGRGVETTAAGQVLANRARRLLADLDSAREEVQAVGLGAHGRLRVAVGAAVVPPQVARLLSAVHVETPNVEVELLNTDDNQALENLRRGEVDVALAPRGQPHPTPSTARGTDSAVITREPIILVFAPDHINLASERVDLNTLTDTALVTLNQHRSPAFHDHITAAWHSTTGSPPRLRTATSMSGLMSMVLAGLGLALLPAGFDRVLWHGLDARPLRHHTPVIETGVWWRKTDDSPIVQRFLRTALSTPEPDMLEPHHARIEPWVDNERR